MRTLVTGGAGFIGSNFIFHMMKAHPEYRIVCLDKLTYAGNLSTLKEVLAVVDGKVPLLVELKSDYAPTGDQPEAIRS